MEDLEKRQNGRGVPEAFRERRVHRTQTYGRPTGKEVGHGAVPTAGSSPADNAPCPGATTCGAWVAV